MLPLGELASGTHTLAVLVQWAPNHRRSESGQPHLIAEVRGSLNGAEVVTASTGAAWHTVRSPAWRADAAQVHEWGILGPTEILDFRALSERWMAASFDDRNWPGAVERVLDPMPVYAERTIPLLANVPISATLLDVGFLSPGHVIVQVEPGRAMELEAQDGVSITVEIPVEAATGEPVVAHVDGEPITWQDGPYHRPDIVQTELPPGAGSYRLAFEQVSPYSFPVSVSPASALRAPASLTQGNHAGRRLLLADPVTDWGAAKAEQSPDRMSTDVEVLDVPAYLVLDLGRVVHGRLYAEVTGPSGTIVDAGWDERLFEDTLRPLPHPGTRHPQWNQVDSWVLDGQSRSISTIDARAGRYVIIAIWGESVVLRGLHILEERYPIVKRGWFQSSNPRLDAIWELGVNTAYPSMQDAYADPWRERGQWWGDAYVADHINQVAFGDSLLLRRGLRSMAAEADSDGSLPAFAPNSDSARMLDYGMLWVQSLQDYVERTGDDAFAQEMLPVLSRFVQHVETLRRSDTGLLDIPTGHWSETALVDWSGQKSRHGQSTVLNSLYVQTLRDAAQVAHSAGDPAAAQVWETRAQAIELAINQWLYVPEQSRYASSILDGQYVTATTHAQVWPLAFGLVPDEHLDSVVDAALDSFWVEIFGMYWALEGLGRAGHVPEAVDLIGERYGTLLDRGATTLWEHWNSDQRYDTALSHAWGGGPTWFLTTYVLGLRQTGPKSWEVRPAFAGVDWAAGAIPLEHKEVVARWHVMRCSKRVLELTAPEGSIGEIVLGLDSVTEISMNGMTLWRRGVLHTGGAAVIDDLIHIYTMAGNHSLHINLACGVRTSRLR